MKYCACRRSAHPSLSGGRDHKDKTWVQQRAAGTKKRMLFDIVNTATANGSCASRDFARVVHALLPRVPGLASLARDTRLVQDLSAARRGGAYARLVVFFARRFFPAPRFFGGGLNTMPSSFMPSGSVK
jgi:hypothetical protein